METSARRGISAAVLKNVAVLTMTIDHVTGILLKKYLQTQGVLRLYDNIWYTLGRDIGRIAFVLYAFMLAEGAYRTHDKAKYALRLLVLAAISIVPHSYCHIGKPFNPNDLNIFFLLFLGLITIYVWDWLKERIVQPGLSGLLQILVLAASCAIAELLKFEYGLMGILLILVFHVYRYDLRKTIIAGALVTTVGYMVHVVIASGAVHWISSHSQNLLESFISTDRVQAFGILALPLIYFYNGKKGKQLSKWFYYLYYPVHLGIIALILPLI